MYQEYFGLKEEPFSIAPDPQFMYMSDRHREALAHLLYGMKMAGGFVLLTGEVGTGKTTVCRCLLEQVPEDSEIAFVLNPKLNVIELLATICDELHIDYPPQNRSIKVFIDALNCFLLDAHSRGRKTVLIIDEAQNLRIDVLEQIRLLTNLETNKQKLLQVIMLGQPELKVALQRPELRQLAQRITARYHLDPLAKNEIQAYVNHRLSVAGVNRPLFPAALIGKLYQLSGGVPRLINLLCDRALLGAYVTEQHSVSPALLSAAANEVFGRSDKPQRTGSPTWQWLLLLLVVIAGSMLLLNTYLQQRPNNQAVLSAAAPSKIPIVRPVSATELKWNSALPLGKNRTHAFQALFGFWGLKFDPQQGTAQLQAETQGLELLLANGNLQLLQRLNRPAVLKLNAPQGQPVYAILTALSDETASLSIDSHPKTVSRADLAARWGGEYALLWRSPAGFSGEIKPGAEGPVVTWLEGQMAALQARSVRKGGVAILDGLLLQEIQAFQAAVGLKADGVVDAYTLILLNSRGDQSQPTLSQKG